MVQFDFSGANVVRIRTHYDQKDRCAAIPGGRWVPRERAWEYLLTPSTAASILQTFNQHINENDRQKFQNISNRLSIAQSVINGECELITPVTKKPCWNHQLITYNMMIHILGLIDDSPVGGGYMAALDMGCGKSKVTVDTICNYPKNINSALIVCPQPVIEVWTGNDERKGQFQIHATSKAYNNLIIHPVVGISVEKKTKNAELVRYRAANLGKQFVAVINYESAWREPFASWALAVGFDLVVLDESHRIKSPGGKASKFFARLAKTARCRLELTGTPMPHALASDANVLTPNGWKQIKSLKIGDYVIGANGNSTEVIGVWPQGVKPLFEVRFCDGAKTICTEDHLWSVISRGRRSRGIGSLTISTGGLSHSRPLPNSNNKLRLNDRKDLFDKYGTPRWSIPLVSSVSFHQKEKLPIDPYLLGVLLGDGHIDRSVDFTTMDQDIVDEVVKVLPFGLQLTKGYQNGKASQYRITSGQKGGSLKGKKRGPKPNQIIQSLEKLNLCGSRSHNKFIPKMYLWSGIYDRQALLQGLCDTDGSSYGSTSKFSTTSKQLAKDVKFLIQSLGGFVKTSIESKKNTKLPSGKIIDGRDQYNLFFRMTLNPFRLKRKANKFIAPWRNASRNIIEVVPVDPGDATCITVEAKDGLYVTEDFVVTHNSPLDIYGQYRFADPGIFGTSFTRFRSEYSVVDMRVKKTGDIDENGEYVEKKQEYGVVQSYRNQEMLHDKMFSIAHRVRSKDVFDLPKFQSEIRTCELSGEERKIYRQMDTQFFVEVENGTVTAANALVKLLRLQEITSGYLEGNAIGDSKKKLLADVLEDFEIDEPLVVCARFTNDLRMIREVAEKQGRKYGELSGDANDLAQWQNGKFDILGVQIKSGKEGVDFTRARYTLLYSLGFSLGDYEQFIKRFDRPGQLREGMYIHLLAKDSVDFKVMKALEERQEVIASVLDQYKHVSSEDVPEFDENVDKKLEAGLRNP